MEIQRVDTVHSSSTAFDARSDAVLSLDAGRLHRWDDATEDLADRTFAYVRDRLQGRIPAATDMPTAAELERRLVDAISDAGMGEERAFACFTDAIARSCLRIDDPRALAFVGHAPAISATLADIALSASAIFADWWLEGAGAIYAENKVLAWLAGLAGLPETAGGVFLSGGTVANLTALHVARHAWRARGGSERAAIAATGEVHASVRLAARVLDVEIVPVRPDACGRMTASALRTALASRPGGVFAVAASAGCTNNGAIDRLPGIAALCRERGIWLHVDGAYGGGALASPAARGRFAGIECADSLVIDPHKWLFTPVDCSALLYRNPALARAACSQSADYLDPVEAERDWNPSDYGLHMTRRARGLPLWLALASHGTGAFATAIDACLDLAIETAASIGREPHLELIGWPELSVVLFRRRGWTRMQYEVWSQALLASGIGLVVPTTWAGEPALRLCFVNPTTSMDHVLDILDTLRD